MKNSNENIQKRREDLRSLLKEAGTLTVRQLSQNLAVSELTIRRDLDILEKMGLIQRQHGSASYIPETTLEDFNAEIENIKERIAKQAANLVHEGDTVFVNTGTTALAALKFIQDKRVTIVTNNIKVATVEHHPDSVIIFSGGEIRFPKETLVGDIAIDSFSRMRSDVTILGCSGLTVQDGFTTSVLHEAKVNAAILKHSPGIKIVVADYRKIGVSSNYTSGSLEDIDVLITDSFANPDVLKEVEAHDVQIIQIPV
ncbi:DeoR/GlpR family transcriptional regulator of sugar metabolism [Enterococcus sp. PF1-24]|uniref:DeoR/GlpR family DNA-binding transcription regulator n=1 Tax=unclassified Enterococcus TaxID=2608891 RepID=UPI002474E1DA|nr:MULTISPECIES: DeoR/GlpR family DNA-binding transcription regulator [unclassified Enterococcus]MDH6363941.1 DeoR/GlpR family transcriptional regulator of sugar metabolism [Enterococcus sp. PFB1-1]MDH6401042.1 DeoR/GlpR family transcriptional regulator of sugar metabolism [Enterococcus sp. PF1-24]